MTTLSLERYDDLLDARNLSCPLPILKTRKALKGMSTGTVLKVLTTDPGAIQDIASFCKTTGNELVGQTSEQSIYSFYIRKN